MAFKSASNAELSASQMPIDWLSNYQSCQRHFLIRGPKSDFVRELCARMNIKLPYQKDSFPAPFRRLVALLKSVSPSLSLIPYISRLVSTRNDTAATFEKFFGSRWFKGIGHFHKLERMNYMFSAKSAPWNKTKVEYDIGTEEKVPFLYPLREVTEEEIVEAEDRWGKWLAMGDWEIGPRSLDEVGGE